LLKLCLLAKEAYVFMEFKYYKIALEGLIY